MAASLALIFVRIFDLVVPAFEELAKAFATRPSLQSLFTFLADFGAQPSLSDIE